MPMINLKCSCDIPQRILKELSGIVADTIGKPEQYVMAVGTHADVMIGGISDPAAFVDVRSIGGLSPDVNRSLSQKICKLIEEELHISSSRIYITFIPLTADSWGWSGSTFG